jgi:hypothetical protein
VEVAEVRLRAAEYAAREAQARALASIGVPPLALLTAAIILGAAVAFSAALAAESLQPRVADAREAERVGDARVLATIRQGAPVAERGRRRSDVEAPPLIEIGSESYRLLYLNFAATGAATPLLTMTGDDPHVVATVAANLAAASAYDARSTLLVDADPAAGAVAGVFRLRADPGYVDVLRGSLDWAEAIVSTHIGARGTIDVVPSGTVRRGEVDARVDAQTRRDFARLVPRYDLSLLVVPLVHAERESGALMPEPDTILCVRVGADAARRARRGARPAAPHGAAGGGAGALGRRRAERAQPRGDRRGAPGVGPHPAARVRHPAAGGVAVAGGPARSQHRSRASPAASAGRPPGHVSRLVCLSL